MISSSVFLFFSQYIIYYTDRMFMSYPKCSWQFVKFVNLLGIKFGRENKFRDQSYPT